MRHTARRRVFSRILLSVIATILLVCFLLWVILLLSDAGVRVRHPDEERIDLSPILSKETLTEEDYALLYRQTGLTKIGIDRAREHGAGGTSRVRIIQRDYLYDWEVRHDHFAPLMCTDFLSGGRHAYHIYLEDGDILLTASTHFSAFRMGHAGIVTNGARSEVLQAVAYGDNSYIGSPEDFTDHASFMILRPKAGSAVAKAAADYARENLMDIPYNAFAGVLTDRNSNSSTQCALLVWKAYQAAGVNLAEGKETVILPYTLANSDELEVVQVFGFDPDTLWDSLFY